MSEADLHHGLNLTNNVLSAHQRFLGTGSDVITSSCGNYFRFIVVGTVGTAGRYRPLLHIQSSASKPSVKNSKQLKCLPTPHQVYEPIYKVLSLAHSALNLQRNNHY